MSQADSDDDHDDSEITKLHPKVVRPCDQYERFTVTLCFLFIAQHYYYYHCRNQSITEQKFVLVQQQPSPSLEESIQSAGIDDTTSADDTTASADITDGSKKKRAKLVYQKASIDEEPDQQTTDEQFPGDQTPDQGTHDQDHHKPLDLQPSDIRSPSFLSLGPEIHIAKQRKSAVVDQPSFDRTGITEEAHVEKSNAPLGEDSSSQVKKEPDPLSDVKTPSGETKEEESTSQAKGQTSDFLQVPPSNQQQQRSFSVPSCPPQLKSILRRSKAPKSLSLDIHNVNEDQRSDGQPQPVHRQSVS